MLEDRPAETRTYAVPRELLDQIQLDTAPDLRELTDDEVNELAAYLETSPDELDGPFRVADASCGECGRRISFVDFVKTGVDEGQHDRQELAEVLSGRAGAWVTIRGQDGGRPVKCAECGELVRALRLDYSEYSGGGYAYA